MFCCYSIWNVLVAVLILYEYFAISENRLHLCEQYSNNNVNVLLANCFQSYRIHFNIRCSKLIVARFRCMAVSLSPKSPQTETFFTMLLICMSQMLSTIVNTTSLKLFKIIYKTFSYIAVLELFEFSKLCLKKTAKLVLSELRQISTNFDNFWQNDGKKAKIMRGALIFYLT